MNHKTIDFRSDTVTKPSEAMLDAMCSAAVGDDVYREDPTVIKLEEIIADKTGFDAAIFAPSGTQTNLLALLSTCERGDEYIVGQSYHTYLYEGGGAAVLGGIQPQPLPVQPDGTLDLAQVESVIKPIDDHYARTKLLSLENTTNGRPVPISYIKDAHALCKKHNLKLHLDGARAFNAAVALNVEIKEITKYFDSVSICLSKGLGAPVGSVLCGSSELITKARRWRKVLGGGMRQAGFIAAAGIYALQNNVKRLHEDHENAAYMASELAKIPEITVITNSVNTNMFYIERPKNYDSLHQHLMQKNVILSNSTYFGKTLRFVMHLDITRSDIDHTLSLMKEFYNNS